MIVGDDKRELHKEGKEQEEKEGRERGIKPRESKGGRGIGGKEEEIRKMINKRNRNHLNLTFTY